MSFLECARKINFEKSFIEKSLAETCVLALCTLAMIGCNGSVSGNTNHSPPPTSPTIASFNPTSGAVGTSVTITGTNFTGATSVKFNGATATFTVSDASHIATSVPNGAISGTVSVTTTSGTATSTGSFTVSVPLSITSFSPTSGAVGTSVTVTGTGFLAASGVKFNGMAAPFGVTDANHINTTVPNGATSGPISVTVNSGGSATSSSSFTVTASTGLDLSIDGLYITQATQNYPAHDVGLISGRSAWVRVFVLANQANTAAPRVNVNFTNGSTTNTLTISAPGSSVPTSVDVTNASASWNAAVPAAWITTGTTVSADVDPSNAIVESNEGNNHFSYGTLNVQTVHQWKITLIPIHTTDGRTGTVENASRTKADLVDPAHRLYPVPDMVDVIVGPTFNSSTAGASPLLLSDGTNWGSVLSELLAKRTADGVTDRYYFGFVNVSYTSGVAGLGYVGAPAAIGWDVTSSGRAGSQWVLAHEEGHNFGRQHSPCGDASNPDPNYPYAGGTIGVPGWDVFVPSGNIKPITDTDIMGYCNNQWISDYVYKSVLSFRVSNSFDVVTQDSAMGAALRTLAVGKEGLLVWGRLEKGQMILEPAFRVVATSAAIAEGPYTWEAKDAKGQVLSRVPFQMYEVADMPNDEPKHFAFVVPLESAALDALDSMHVMRGTTELALQKSKTAAQSQSAMRIFRIVTLPNRKAEIHWDALTHPVAMLRDAKTGEVRGFLRGGDATIEDLPDNAELQLSDGVKSSVVLRTGPSSQ